MQAKVVTNNAFPFHEISVNVRNMSNKSVVTVTVLPEFYFFFFFALFTFTSMKVLPATCLDFYRGNI